MFENSHCGITPHEHAQRCPGTCGDLAPEDQDKLAEYAREIEARRTGIYTMSDDERLAVARGLAEADRGEFVADELVAEADKRHGR